MGWPPSAVHCRVLCQRPGASVNTTFDFSEFKQSRAANFLQLTSVINCTQISVFFAETTEKLRQISVFWPKFHENFCNKSVISVTKYWNSVTLGSPEQSSKCQVCHAVFEAGFRVFWKRTMSIATGTSNSCLWFHNLIIALFSLLTEFHTSPVPSVTFSNNLIIAQRRVRTICGKLTRFHSFKNTNNLPNEVFFLQFCNLSVVWRFNLPKMLWNPSNNFRRLVTVVVVVVDR